MLFKPHSTSESRYNKIKIKVRMVGKLNASEMSDGAEKHWERRRLL